MTDFLRPFSMKEMFEPNCRVTLNGEHFFADKKLYTNIYGVAFFSEPGDYTDNPHISPALSGFPSLIDEFIGDGMPLNSHVRGDYPIRSGVMSNVDKRFTAPPKKSPSQGPKKLSGSFLGNLSIHGDDSLVLVYGSIIPATVCITDDAVSMMLPFSPFSSISFIKGKRILQTVDYPYRATPHDIPEDIAVDFSTYTKDLSLMLREDLTGTLKVEYYLEVGASKCESASFTLDFAPLAPQDGQSDLRKDIQ